MPRRSADLSDLVARTRESDPRAVARLISLVEADSPQLREVAAALTPFGSQAQIVGLTGAPGVGKSTTTSALVTALRVDDRRVGVLAVDPSSPFSGGALLGDRVRMQEHAVDDGVFIRSMASRGQLGGLSAAVPQALRILDVARCDVVLVETVGVGQAEVQIASLADTTLLVLAPGMGDGIQAAKAGIIEIADVFVVNKADRDGAGQVARDVRSMQSLGARHGDDQAWQPPIVKASATTGDGIDKIIASIAEHRAWLTSHQQLDVRRRARAATEIEAIALGQVRRQFGAVPGSAALDAAAARVVDGTTDPYTAAEELIAAL